jgi:hypothetical protein
LLEHFISEAGRGDVLIKFVMMSRRRVTGVVNRLANLPIEIFEKVLRFVTQSRRLTNAPPTNGPLHNVGGQFVRFWNQHLHEDGEYLYRDWAGTERMRRNTALNFGF